MSNKEILPFATTLMNLEDSMISVARWRQTLCDFTHMWNIEEKWNGGYQALRDGGMSEVLVKWHKSSLISK